MALATAPIHDIVAPLVAALDDAAELHLAGRSRTDIGDWLCQLQAVRARTDALVAIATAEADLATVQTLDRCRSVSSFVALHTPADPAQIGNDRKLGHWLNTFAEFSNAAASGTLTRRHLSLLQDNDNLRTHNALLDSQEFLIAAAQNFSFNEFRNIVRYWVLAADPDGEEPEAQHQSRKAQVRKRGDGTVIGNFTLDPITGHAVTTAIEREVERLRAEDADTGNDRSAAQRRADALANLITRGALRADGTTNPLVHITAGLETTVDAVTRYPTEPVATEPDNPWPDDTEWWGEHAGGSSPTEASDDDDDDDDAAAGPTDTGESPENDPSTAPTGCTPDPNHLPVDYLDPLRRCELIDGTPIHPAWLPALLANAALRRLIVHDSEVIDLGTTFRVGANNPLSAEMIVAEFVTGASASPSSNAPTFPPHHKHALLAAARGRCEHPGCNAPVVYLQADHIDPRNHGGPTHLNNGQILCAYHNAIKGDRLRETPSCRCGTDPDPAHHHTDHRDNEAAPGAAFRSGELGLGEEAHLLCH